MRFRLTIFACRIIKLACKVFRKEGSVIIGYWALKLYPNILSKVKYPKIVVGVTGSTGKGTTSELIANLLKENGYNVAFNNQGSNVLNAIATLIVNNTNFNKTFKKNALVMELDERHSVHILKHFNLTHYIVTNILRDQPPRNIHPQKIYEEIIKNISKTDTLIINADDPIVYKMYFENPDKNYIYYGIEKNNYSEKTSLNNIDASYCPICNKKLEYKYYHYGHLGNYICPSKDFKRPDLDFKATNIDIDNKKIRINNNKIILQDEYLYSVYAYLAAYALGKSVGIDDEAILSFFEKLSKETKIYNSYIFDNRNWQMLSSKNENNLSYKQSLDFINHQKGLKTIVLGFDNSSRRYKENDLSWIWDIDFEELNNKNIDKIVVLGRFKYDVINRLEYAGIDNDKLLLINNLKEELIPVLKNSTKGNIYSMVCFDKEIELKEILKKEGVNIEN